MAGSALESELELSQRNGAPLRGTLIRWRRLARRKPLGTVGLLLCVSFVVLALGAGLLGRQDPTAQHALARLQAPSQAHWFGTDDSGRDIYARVVHGARVSIPIGFFSVALGGTLGTLVGLISAYLGGWEDLMMQRVVDGFMAIPALVLAIVIVAMFGTGIDNLIVAISIAIAPGVSRIVRGAALSVKEMPYVEAARALGAGAGRIMGRHLLPNVAAPLLIILTGAIGNAILAESSLAFLGLGVPPPAPSWGSMLSGAGRLYFEKAPWMALFPGIAITLAVLGFNLVGDALRDLWDPRLRGT